MDYEEKKKIISMLVEIASYHEKFCYFIQDEDCPGDCVICKGAFVDALTKPSDADKLVEEHGGLEAVKSKFASDKAFGLFTVALRSRDELEKEIQKLKDEKAEVIHANVEFPEKLIKAVGIDETPKREPEKVLDADGVEIKIGDKLYMVDDNAWDRNAIYKDSEREPFTVTRAHLDPLGRIHANSADEAKGAIPWFICPETMTHKQPDSWEKLEKDACKSECDYFGFYSKPCDGCPAVGRDINCREVVGRDIVKRAKALSEKDQE